MTCPRTHNKKGTEQDSYIVVCNSKIRVCAHMLVRGFLFPCQGERVSYSCFKPSLDRGGRVPTYSISKRMRMSGVIHQLFGAQHLGRTQSFHSPLIPEYDLSSAKSPRCQNLILISRTPRVHMELGPIRTPGGDSCLVTQQPEASVAGAPRTSTPLGMCLPRSGGGLAPCTPAPRMLQAAASPGRGALGGTRGPSMLKTWALTKAACRRGAVTDARAPITGSELGAISSVFLLVALWKNPIIPALVQVVPWPPEPPGLLEASDSGLSPSSCRCLSRRAKTLLFNAIRRSSPVGFEISACQEFAFMLLFPQAGLHWGAGGLYL